MADAVRVAGERYRAAECKIGIARIANGPAAGLRGEFEEAARRAERRAGALVIDRRVRPTFEIERTEHACRAIRLMGCGRLRARTRRGLPFLQMRHSLVSGCLSLSRKILPSTAERDTPSSSRAIMLALAPSAHRRASNATRASFQS